MSKIILESGGTIDKYEGDAIIAFWNAPLSFDDHSSKAVHAALECQKQLDLMRDELEKMSGAKIYQRIGLNTGYAIVGNMGSVQRFDYTMLGDSVNLASRLEGLNKQFGTYLMCSKETKDQAQKFDNTLCFRKLANVAVVGKSLPVVVYEPIPREQYFAKENIIKDFEKALDLFIEGDFVNAKEIFERHHAQDVPSKIYFEKCIEYIEKPPTDYTGVWISKSK